MTMKEGMKKGVSKERKQRDGVKLTEFHVRLQGRQVQYYVVSLRLGIVGRTHQVAKDGVAGDRDGHVLAAHSVRRRKSGGQERRVP